MVGGDTGHPPKLAHWSTPSDIEPMKYKLQQLAGQPDRLESIGEQCAWPRRPRGWVSSLLGLSPLHRGVPSLFLSFHLLTSHTPPASPSLPRGRLDRPAGDSPHWAARPQGPVSDWRAPDLSCGFLLGVPLPPAYPFHWFLLIACCRLTLQLWLSQRQNAGSCCRWTFLK